jgi:hypothetical protein
MKAGIPLLQCHLNIDGALQRTVCILEFGQDCIT